MSMMQTDRFSSELKELGMNDMVREVRLTDFCCCVGGWEAVVEVTGER